MGQFGNCMSGRVSANRLRATTCDMTPKASHGASARAVELLNSCESVEEQLDFR